MATATKNTRTRTAPKGKGKGDKVKVATDERPDSGAKTRTATVDPFDTSTVAPNAAPTAKKGDNVYTADTDTAKLIDAFVTANSAAKKAKATADAAKGAVMAWAKGKFAAQYVADGSRPKNPTLKGRTTAPKFIVSDSEVNVDADRFATLQDLFGDKADDTVTLHESFAFDSDFLNDEGAKAKIVSVLRGDQGRRLSKRQLLAELLLLPDKDGDDDLDAELTVLDGADSEIRFSADDVKAMIVATVKRTTKKGSIDRVLGLLGDDAADAGNVELALEILTKAPSIK